MRFILMMALVSYYSGRKAPKPKPSKGGRCQGGGCAVEWLGSDSSR